MLKRVISSVVGLCIWGAVLYLGLKLYSGIAPQEVPGYPNPDQYKLLVGIPTAMVVLSVLLLAVSRRLPAWLFICSSIAQFGLVLPLIMLFGGGA